ncbi:MAG: bifunctional phosphopantothenoylcysteine decarboxylase/phosphopantothenate synthase, phosphopantothenoylcysteine decarboxylase / phosphopantothenate-cysteine ligase [Candidatus Gottesmanbacteria bacterium GW2011_GWA2_43_14]|uniref:Coenzyme A biosynthesis bifunctional protein CoaBC n=1 Tax=Candidatus Gottesmanbacteria bacterium GW2011_GWA2_43_14 TaxID=1618443 RepID=A0A0G1FM12_9BACT|nr:MAG: bifunctional phosphopantothenoylcysteine decarboxylase/phosphopantothenate synthase, phosphopantothenoylcysteine decarboxylase / phosphopantothenate-cysteine ligase [Candidatus Gottesmanbacteria bacterium GW2011_GWA2_43_14]
MKKNTIVIGITSGIAAYKVVSLIRLLKTQGFLVEVVMTDTAVAMFGAEMFEKETGKPVFHKLVGKDFSWRDTVERKEVDHIRLADRADLLLIAPTTANTIAKLAAGIADNFLTTLALAVTCPVAICPSMNVHMWGNPVVQKNLESLKKRGFIVIPPDSGSLACGYTGVGRLKDTEEIAGKIGNIIKRGRRLTGSKILVTAGGTAEYIDSVRILTNKASGRMGLAIAGEAKLRGAEVLLLRSEKSVSDPFVPEKTFTTSSDLKKLLETYTPVYDIIFHSAAVSDFMPEKSFKGKIESSRDFELRFRHTDKLIDTVKKLNPEIKLIGFKAVFGLKETEIAQIADKMFVRSGADFICVNDIKRADIGFEARDNEIWLVTKRRAVVKLEKAPKEEIAAKLLDLCTRKETGNEKKKTVR